MNFELLWKEYINKIQSDIDSENLDEIQSLSEAIKSMRLNKNKLFICGNGGSAANAMHLENDFLYSLNVNVESLTSNTSVLTCLANDTGYDNIFSHQLKVKAKKGDILLVLSGSGNSENIIKAIEEASKISMTTYAILGYSGGKVKQMVNHPIHFNIDDMQISEDLQLIVGHMIMQLIRKKEDS